ncbi:hypothetical protein [Aquiflexum balticum]|nr:hypothetical protein [Aquiflexum balticum]
MEFVIPILHRDWAIGITNSVLSVLEIANLEKRGCYSVFEMPNPDEWDL